MLRPVTPLHGWPTGFLADLLGRMRDTPQAEIARMARLELGGRKPVPS